MFVDSWVFPALLYLCSSMDWFHPVWRFLRQHNEEDQCSGFRAGSSQHFIGLVAIHYHGSYLSDGSAFHLYKSTCCKPQQQLHSNSKHSLPSTMSVFCKPDHVLGTYDHSTNGHWIHGPDGVNLPAKRLSYSAMIAPCNPKVQQAIERPSTASQPKGRFLMAPSPAKAKTRTNFVIIGN